MRSGGCLCGAVRYEIRGAMRPVVACHCAQCRRTSGHFVAASACRRAGLAVSGEVSWYRSSARARRGLCGVCGSSLFWEADGAATVSVHAGTLDGPTGLRLAGHTHAGARGDYYEIADGLPCAAAGDARLTQWSGA